jgi:hypothetical protein
MDLIPSFYSRIDKYQAIKQLHKFHVLFYYSICQFSDTQICTGLSASMLHLTISSRSSVDYELGAESPRVMDHGTFKICKILIYFVINDL